MEFTVNLPILYDTIHNILDYGAVPSGSVSNTKAIQMAIDHASVHGGKVVIPKGIYLSGPIELKSNVNLHIEEGGILLFDKSQEDYPLYMGQYEGLEMIRARSPISSYHSENIAITGKGMIDGNGHMWRPVKKWKVTELEWKTLLEESTYVYQAKEAIWFPSKSSYEGFLKEKGMRDTIKSLDEAEKYYDYYRPVMIHLNSCKNVLIEDITLTNSPAWNIHPLFCEHITIRHSNIRNPHYAQNGDGLDLESCKYVYINDCTFDVGDDAICIKSGKGEKARKVTIPTEYVRIENCVVYHGHGGFVVGSEMSRGVRHVSVSNCSFIGTDIGIRFKSALGRGGLVENITIDNIQMLNIKKEAMVFMMSYALDYDDTSESKFTSEDIPYFKNIDISNITCNGAKIGMKIEGISKDTLEEYNLLEYGYIPTIDKIRLRDSYINAELPYLCKDAGNIRIENVSFGDK